MLDVDGWKERVDAGKEHSPCGVVGSTKALKAVQSIVLSVNTNVGSVEITG